MEGNCMQTTTLETSKKIYKLLGWFDKKGGYSYVDWGAGAGYQLQYIQRGKTVSSWLPTYDLAYLLERLPVREDPDFGEEQMYYPGVHMTGTTIDDTHAIAGYWDIDGELWGDWSEIADNPTEAAGLLVCSLAEAGILTREMP